MYETTGILYGFKEPVIRKITFDKNEALENHCLCYLQKMSNKVTLTNDAKTEKCEIISSSFELNQGDILLVEPKGKITKIYDVTSKSNSLFITEECNCRCQTCPQPPVITDSLPWAQFAKLIVKLIDNKPKWIGITGGEPTIKWDELIEVLKLIDYYLPDSAIQLLSNSRIFSEFKKAELLSPYCNKLIIGTALFSDVDEIHDAAMGKKGSFWETISGLHNLERFGIPIEIRIVLSSISVKRLPQLAEFIYKNIPFVHHVAFMGFEPIGNGLKNFKKLWIDPLEFNNILLKSVKVLHSRNIKSVLFNLQPCLVDKKLHQILMNSISEWKICYDDECNGCSALNSCGGIFNSAVYYLNKSIKALP